MPAFDGTGPMGYGPGTGWGLGPCGAGMGWRRGGGRRFARRRFGGYSPTVAPTKKEEAAMLSEEADVLRDELEAIKERLSELEDQK